MVWIDSPVYSAARIRGPGMRSDRSLIHSPSGGLFQHFLRRRQMNLIDHPAVEQDRTASFGVRRCHGGNDALGFGYLLLRWHEDLVDDLEVRRMDGCLAVVAQVARCLA